MSTFYQKKVIPLKIKLVVLSTIVTISVLLSGCGGANNNATNNAPPAADNGVTAAADPETLYKQNCTSCHGDTLSKMRNANLSNVGARLSKDDIHTKIAKGGGGMIAFEGRLEANEIDALADWLAAKK